MSPSISFPSLLLLLWCFLLLPSLLFFKLKKKFILVIIVHFVECYWPELGLDVAFLIHSVGLSSVPPDIINPWHACAARVTVVGSVCLSVNQHLSSGASVRLENAIT